MENASKALIMAGGVFISLLVIGLLVFFFNNIRDLQGIESTAEATEQAAEFNKQYDVYARNVYGSELLSLANKINDYNKREAENKGYSRIELYVTITKDMDTDFFKAKKYNAAELENEKKSLENEVDELAKKEIAITNEEGKRVSLEVKEIATMRTNELEKLGFKREDYKDEVTKYNTYKTLLTQIKAQVFKYDDFDYDDYNGRITIMKYEI